MLRYIEINQQQFCYSTQLKTEKSVLGVKFILKKCLINHIYIYYWLD